MATAPLSKVFNRPFYQWQQSLIQNYLDRNSGAFEQTEMARAARRVVLGEDKYLALPSNSALREALTRHTTHISATSLSALPEDYMAAQDAPIMDAFEENWDSFRIHARTGKSKRKITEDFTLQKGTGPMQGGDEPIFDSIVTPEGNVLRGMRIEHNVPENRLNGLRTADAYIVELPATPAMRRDDFDIHDREGHYIVTSRAIERDPLPRAVIAIPVPADWKALLAQPGGVEFRPPAAATQSPVERLRVMDQKIDPLYCQPQGYIRVDIAGHTVTDSASGATLEGYCLGLDEQDHFIIVPENTYEAHMDPDIFGRKINEFAKIMDGTTPLSALPVRHESAPCYAYNKFAAVPRPGAHHNPGERSMA